MKYQGNGKYTIEFKGHEINDVTIDDLRSFYDSLDENLAREISYRYKRKYGIGEYSFNDIENFLNDKQQYTGNLNTIFVKDIYKCMNLHNNISKKKAAVIIAEKFKKSIKTIEKHLYKSN